MKKLDIYIAASWKHQHAVEMLTHFLREAGHVVHSFVENNHGEYNKSKNGKVLPFEEWVWSAEGEQAFNYDTTYATTSDLVIYIGCSGKDAAAELGAAWGRGIPIIGLHAKGEDFGLMRRMMRLWVNSHQELLRTVKIMAEGGLSL